MRHTRSESVDIAEARTIAGLILCGGRSTRMGGGDKCLLQIGGRPMLARIVERAAAQTETMAISANGDPARFAQFGLPILPDPVEGYAGPLAGILAGLDWAAGFGNHASLASFAGDTPFFPRDLVEKLDAAVHGQAGLMAVASSQGRPHPVIALWPVALAEELRLFLHQGESRSVSAFMASQRVVTVEFGAIDLTCGSIDPFFNINRPKDLDEARRVAKEMTP